MVSVCLATYNGGKYIKEQIDSILIQLGKEDEIIVSDDGSSDMTLDLLKNYQDSRIKIFSNKQKNGVIGNFENALRKASGDHIFLCDQDDIWQPNKVSRTLFYLESYDLVVSDCSIIDEKNNIICQSFFDKHNSGPGFWKNIAKNAYLGCCMAFNKDVLDYILPFPKHIAMHDIWIGLSVELNGKTCFSEEVLMFYRRHGNNASSSSEKSNLSISYRLIYRLQMLYYLYRRKFIKK